MTEIQKMVSTFAVSLEMLYAERFPRRMHTTTKPLTDLDRSDYAAFAERWGAASAEWEDVQHVGEQRGWARAEGGYEYEPAELLPLEPIVEIIFDEPVDEWFERVGANIAHHNKTGEWLEEPRPSFMERMHAAVASQLAAVLAEKTPSVGTPQD